MLQHLLQLCERDGTFDNMYLYVVIVSSLSHVVIVCLTTDKLC